MPRNKRKLSLTEANALYDDIVSKGGNPLIVSRPKDRDTDDGIINIHQPLDEVTVTANYPSNWARGTAATRNAFGDHPVINIGGVTMRDGQAIGEQPLESVSPEFDFLSLGGGKLISKGLDLTKKGINKGLKALRNIKPKQVINTPVYNQQHIGGVSYEDLAHHASIGDEQFFIDQASIMPEYINKEAYDALVAAGFNPSRQNLANSMAYMQFRTPNPKIPYKDIKEFDTDFLANSHAYTGEVHIPYAVDDYIKDLGNLAEYNATKAHEYTHATGIPTNETYNELLKVLGKDNIKLKDYDKELKDYIDEFLEEQLVRQNAHRQKNGWDTFNTVEDMLSHPDTEGYMKSLVDYKKSKFKLEDRQLDKLKKQFNNITGQKDADYLLGELGEANATEVDARLGQILNYLGIDNLSKTPVNGEILKNGFLAYPGIDNNMSSLFNILNYTKSWDKIAEMVNARKLGKIVIPGVVGSSAIQQSNKKKFGSRISLEDF